ncbi:hypothetical protein HYPBUDRAFT_110887 [Hyphopichia burtonii NRRL Y-1933]|uniref:Cell wall mannoprotein PIR1-like C-terminal domain-containing protein n=1 Tax=Hyphopichia burtonii NRRL Y-1933 TaxID=984485 RepID=A0A1E4RH46_9ASCO|nr:hypothetical protein HYPBUDRAFT_110887 [Hyphopichia burtonii NRRL Y-1933]ODV66435.1 hypothetical protein HYPBUDRAFT_110887 [Hyphopichia burtonii NRRL Y-1933]
MKYSTVFTASAFAATSLAATVPSEPWTTLTPTGSAPTGASTDHTHKFGISIKTVSDASASASSAPAKRDGVVNQIGDGQIQQQTSETYSAPKPTTASVINQIGDGQIQHQTAQTTASVINQIGDGQIQHQTAQTASVINQIGDGQIQHQTAATSANVASQIGDGQVQQSTETASADDKSDGNIPQACMGSSALSMELKSSVLTDSKGRIGAIVANRQFQFDGPPPQEGSIYAAGWSVTSEGLLALGDQTTFYQCASGDFYNLYDENIAAQCAAVELSIIDLVSC